ncbi:MAG: T9SS type A sorting domain-containing protein [Saprospiraceae bacterium]
MKSFFTKNLALIAVSFLFSGVALQAQTYWEEQFDGGLNGWTVEDILFDNDSITWIWSPTGNVGSGAFAGANTAIQSASVANGTVLVNYDYYMTGGVAANAPAFPYPDYQGDIISPPIDLSNVNTPLNIEFTQLIRRLNAVSGNFFSSYSFSTDDGVTWSDQFDANDGLPNNAQNVMTNTKKFPIPTSLGLEGSSNVRVKFTYAGDFYYWVLDDIKITARTQPDMQANDNWYAIAPSVVTPKDLVTEMHFMNDIENVGGVVETGVNLNITIQDETTGNTLYTADQPYGTMIVDSLAENIAFGAFTPPTTAGIFKGTYTLTSDSTDANPDNNVIEFTFENSESTFAKETGSTRDVAPAADNSFSYGNCFYVPFSGYKATTVTFGVANASAVSGQLVTTKLIKVLGDLDESGQLEMEEYELVTFNGYTFDGSEDDQLITIPIDIDGNNIDLEAETNYLITVEYADVSNQELFYLSADNNDYGAMVFAAAENGKERFGSLLDVGLDGTFSIIGFGYDLVPVVRMDVAKASGVNNQLAADNKIELFPNPATNFVNLDINLVEAASQFEVRIVDITGKVMNTFQFDNIQRDRLELNVSNLNSGSYFARVITAEGERSIPFVVQK